MSRRRRQSQVRSGSVSLREIEAVGVRPVADGAAPIGGLVDPIFVVPLATGTAAGVAWRWIPDDDHVWVPGRTLGDADESSDGAGASSSEPVECRLANGGSRMVAARELGPWITDTEEINVDTADMVRMSDVLKMKRLKKNIVRWHRSSTTSTVGPISESLVW